MNKTSIKDNNNLQYNNNTNPTNMNSNNNSSNSLNKTCTNYNSNKSHNNNNNSHRYRYSFRTLCSFPTKTLKLALTPSKTIITLYRNKPSRIGDRWLNMSSSRWWSRWCSRPKNLSFNIHIHIRVYININIHRLPPPTRLHHTPIPCHHNLVHSSSNKSTTTTTTLNNKISNSKRIMTTWSVVMGWRGCPVRWDDEWWDSNPIE